MIDKIKEFFTNKLVQSIIRKLMVLVSGWLLALGVDPQVVQSFTDSGTAVLIAVALYLIAQLWSLVQKKA